MACRKLRILRWIGRVFAEGRCRGSRSVVGSAISGEEESAHLTPTQRGVPRIPRASLRRAPKRRRSRRHSTAMVALPRRSVWAVWVVWVVWKRKTSPATGPAPAATSYPPPNPAAEPVTTGEAARDRADGRSSPPRTPKAMASPGRRIGLVAVKSSRRARSDAESVTSGGEGRGLLLLEEVLQEVRAGSRLLQNAPRRRRTVAAATTTTTTSR
mmetsp:Transcript_23635/g.40352  ORF Transcript_23635/g.40352 Transcript_23635/m.40352 type:complete len:213 (+) Transcript_23635:1444-2082(+)